MKLYKCKHCGTVFEMIYSGESPCMDKFEEIYPNSTEGATEKHIPIVHVDGSTIKVRVANLPHPMEEKHWITSIFVIYNNHVLRKDLTPNDIPEAEFNVGNYHGEILVYEYCNLHGLWKTGINI